MSPKWTLRKTSFSIPLSTAELSKPYSQAASVTRHTAAELGRSERGQITATNQESRITTWDYQLKICELSLHNEYGFIFIRKEVFGHLKAFQ